MPSDWAADAAGRIETLVTTVRANTVDRLAMVVRLVVYGLVGMIMAVMALLLLVIAAIRGLDVLLPRSVWLADVVLGAIFVLLGLGLWSKRGQLTTAGVSSGAGGVPAPSTGAP